MQKVTPEQLIAFEADIASEFDAGKIHAPVHLSGGNEAQLIDIFKEVRAEDWCLSTWRSHYHALLKGIPPAEVRRQILDGRSMFISSPEHKFLSSAMVGGMLPIACGLAFQGERVWCFVGDMCASLGVFRDAVKFADGHNLDVKFIVENNGLSTNTPTTAAWAYGTFNLAKVREYHYKRTWPHYQPLPSQQGF